MRKFILLALVLSLAAAAVPAAAEDTAPAAGKAGGFLLASARSHHNTVTIVSKGLKSRSTGGNLVLFLSFSLCFVAGRMAPFLQGGVRDYDHR